MILHAIELTHVGMFRHPARVGPFIRGVNVLAAPNETGKSTTIKATARALFDKHTTKGEELKSLQPAGSDLAPRIAVEFATAAGRFRIEKTFLQSPRSLLAQWQSGAWQPLAEADAADQRVQALLQSSLPGKGATKPEHWGLLGFLWARQGEPTEWPDLSADEAAQKIRHRLARVELDPVVERLRDRLAAIAESIITTTGQAKTGGPLKQVEDELTAIDGELSKLRETRERLQSAENDFSSASADVARLEAEEVERKKVADELRRQAEDSEHLQSELKAHESALNNAREKLREVAGDVASLARLQREIVEKQQTLPAADKDFADTEKALGSLQQKLGEKRRLRPELESELGRIRFAHQRTSDLLKLRQLERKAGELGNLLKRAEKKSGQEAELTTKKAKLPEVTPARLQRLEEASVRIRELRAQVQALGLTVELTPTKKAEVTIEQGGKEEKKTLGRGATETLNSPDNLTLRLKGWGRIVIHSGAKEATEVAADLTAGEKSMRQALLDAQVPSLEAAREALNQRKELDRQIKDAQTALDEHLEEYDSIDELREAATTAQKSYDALRETVRPTENESSFTAARLEADAERFGGEIKAADKAVRALDSEVDGLADEERAAAQRLTRAKEQQRDIRNSIEKLESRIRDLSARYPKGLDDTKTQAQAAFTEAEARYDGARQKLPTDFEKLPERNRRAAAALQQITNELKTRREARDVAKGSLEALGGQGIYSRETELLERRDAAENRRNAARAKAWAARIAHDLIVFRKQAATKAILAPLEQRLTAAFASVTGDMERQVFLDESLMISGLGRTREQAHPFTLLSQGAKEQLLLCLRIAVAQEVAADEPQVLILDDVLVNTDPTRQERVLDTLTNLADKIQVIILTCHPDHYRGIGQLLNIEPVPA